jgi:hypothetical protein
MSQLADDMVDEATVTMIAMAEWSHDHTTTFFLHSSSIVLRAVKNPTLLGILICHEFTETNFTTSHHLIVIRRT